MANTSTTDGWADVPAAVVPPAMAQPRLLSTYTYAVLEVSPATYDEVKRLLEAAGYEHAFHVDDGQAVIDMNGIALAVGPALPQADGDPGEESR